MTEWLPVLGLGRDGIYVHSHGDDHGGAQLAWPANYTATPVYTPTPFGSA